MVEWGFLYSPKNQGQPGRYPSAAFIEEAFEDLPQNVQVALHVCGPGVLDLLNNEPVVTGLVRKLEQRGGRVQLNFAAHTHKFTLAQVGQCLERFERVRFITQYNTANLHVWQELLAHPNHAILFDASGGRGLSPQVWPQALPGVSCGYAGGLGAENLARELHWITEAASGQPFWIDMEGKLRDVNDRFNPNAVGRCLQIVADFLLQASR
jgi:hypothetical protein